MMESSPTSLLLCNEDLSSLDYEEDEQDFEECVQDYDNDYIQMLLDREITNLGPQMPNSWIETARFEAIQYILRKRELLGFGFQTAYSSVTFLDRYLSRRSLEVEKSWAIRLLAMACLSLAAKVEEIRVPLLSEFCLDDYNFKSSVIQRMELLVLNTLEWKMGPITPFAFTNFFANKFCAKKGFSRIVEVILSSMRDAKIMCHKPSVISAAATLFVLDQELTKDALKLKIEPLSSTHSLEIENIISCYKLLQDMDIEGLKLIQGIKSPDFSPIQLQQHPHLSSGASSKRKRLVFNQEDDHLDKKKNTI